MIDFKRKLKRQIEILGVCLSQNYSGHIKTSELAELFSVEELTINRDLKELREDGINIHSIKGKGVSVVNYLVDNKLKELIQQYTSLAINYDNVDKSTSLMVLKLKEKALANVVLLQLSIENKFRVLIDYEKESGSVDFRREVWPLKIFERENYWRLLAMHNGVIKQFHLNKILDVKTTVYKFDPVPESVIEDLFKYSWRTWLGNEKISVKLKLSQVWADRLLPKQLMEHEKITESDEGWTYYETVVNSIWDLAGWISSKGEGVIVIEPEELKNEVIKIGQGILKNYPV